MWTSILCPHSMLLIVRLIDLVPAHYGLLRHSELGWLLFFHCGHLVVLAFFIYDCSLSGSCLLVLVIASPFGCSMWSSRHLPMIASTLLVVGHTTGLYYFGTLSLAATHCGCCQHGYWFFTVDPGFVPVVASFCSQWHSNFMGSTGEMLLFVSCVVNLFTLFLFSVFLFVFFFYFIFYFFFVTVWYLLWFSSFQCLSFY